MTKTILSTLALSAISFSLMAQQYTPLPKYSVRVGLAMDKILSQTGKTEPYSSPYTSGLFTDVALQMDTTTAWVMGHSFPRVGASIVYNRYRASSIGHSVAIIPFIENTLPAVSHVVSFYYHIGLGLGYISNVFDSIENPENRNITSHVNVAVDLRAGMEFYVSKNLTGLLGAGLLHYSNGATKLPNYGLNLGQLYIGVRYNFGRQVYKPMQRAPFKKNKQEWLINLHAGLRTILDNQKSYPVYGLMAEYNLVLDRGHILGIGAAIMNSAFWEEYNAWGKKWSRGDYEKYSQTSFLNLGPYINYELVFSRLSGYLQVGVYLLNTRKQYTTQIDYGLSDGPLTHTNHFPDSYIFNRVGLRYRFKHNLMVNLGLRTHTFKAQNVEIGIGTHF